MGQAQNLAMGQSVKIWRGGMEQSLFFPIISHFTTSFPVLECTFFSFRTSFPVLEHPILF